MSAQSETALACRILAPEPGWPPGLYLDGLVDGMNTNIKSDGREWVEDSLFWETIELALTYHGFTLAPRFCCGLHPEAIVHESQMTRTSSVLLALALAIAAALCPTGQCQRELRVVEINTESQTSIAFTGNSSWAGTPDLPLDQPPLVRRQPQCSV